jgi:hypothetical protein
MSLSDEPPMNKEFGDVRTEQGTAQPSDEETKIASDIIAAVPKGLRPVEVAGFFLDVAAGKYRSEWQPYTRAWPKTAHANPLILAFFRRINAIPAGDTTAWCAAFVNWCLLQSNGSSRSADATPPTKSASSGSFRTWGKSRGLYDARSNTLTSNFQPRLGDVVVFQEMLSDGSPDPMHGHVGFFLEMSLDAIRVLGGNQFEGRPIVHAINAKWIPKIQTGLQLHSIHSDPSL